VDPDAGNDLERRGQHGVHLFRTVEPELAVSAEIARHSRRGTGPQRLRRLFRRGRTSARAVSGTGIVVLVTSMPSRFRAKCGFTRGHHARRRPRLVRPTKVAAVVGRPAAGEGVVSARRPRPLCAGGIARGRPPGPTSRGFHGGRHREGRSTDRRHAEFPGVRGGGEVGFGAARRGHRSSSESSALRGIQEGSGGPRAIVGPQDSVGDRARRRTGCRRSAAQAEVARAALPVFSVARLSRFDLQPVGGQCSRTAVTLGSGGSGLTYKRRDEEVNMEPQPNNLRNATRRCSAQPHCVRNLRMTAPSTLGSGRLGFESLQAHCPPLPASTALSINRAGHFSASRE